MRSLKRALSLTLASVMLLGMMVVGAGAAGFPDVNDDEHHVEAIEVLQAIDVMVGDNNGNFGPEDQVNRAQMAVIMANLLKLDYNYYKGTETFWDVPDWAKTIKVVGEVWNITKLNSPGSWDLVTKTLGYADDASSNGYYVSFTVNDNGIDTTKVTAEGPYHTSKEIEVAVADKDKGGATIVIHVARTAEDKESARGKLLVKLGSDDKTGTPYTLDLSEVTWVSVEDFVVRLPLAEAVVFRAVG